VNVFATRIHGRGGQGVVTAAELLSVAAFHDGRYAQAFPSFGSERNGAPVISYIRISDAPIRLREPIIEPHALIIQDATLLHQVNVFQGVNDEAYILINSTKPWEELGLDEFVSNRHPRRHISVPASDYAMEYIGRPLPNAALIGGFAAETNQVTFESVERAIAGHFSARVAEANVAAAKAAYDFVLQRRAAQAEVHRA
jgi:pyruvate ferredoxin oxidoreductase gamma subunit